jgi:phage terminase large subunit
LAKPLALTLEQRAFYANRPVAFCRDTFIVGKNEDGSDKGVELDREQQEFLISLAKLRDRKMVSESGKKKHGVTVRSGQGVGKTAVVALAVLWWLYVHPTAKIPITSTKREQLADNLWPEIGRWIMRSKLRDDYVWAKEKVFLRGLEEINFAVARTGSTAETLQGYHDDFLFVLVEEASGVPDEVFEPLEGTLTNEGAVLGMVGNPTRASGHFYDSFHRDKPYFHNIHIPQVYPDGTLHARIAQDHVDRMRDKYGEASNIYRIRVLGEFPFSDPDVLIPYEIVAPAIDRDVGDVSHFRPVWGVDVAYMGDDKSALAKRQGRKLLDMIRTWSHYDTVQLAGAIIREYEDTPEKMRPEMIYVDVIGYGAGVRDHLRAAELPVRGINVAESASSSDQFQRKRDELWWRAREWFKAEDCSLPNDEELITELTTPKYENTLQGKIRVEQKADIKKRLAHQGSPDRADAFCLTFAGGRDLMTEASTSRLSAYQSDRYSRHSGTSYMSY